MTVTRFIIVWVFCCLAGIADAQTDTSFWFAAPEITFNEGPPHSDRPISLHFTTLSKPATITISQPANSSFIPIQLALPANSSGLQDLTLYIDSLETQPANKALNYGLLIRSTAFISAYYEESSPSNPEIFVLKGRNALGKSFFIPAQNVMQNGLTPGKLKATSSFDIVATENNTIITIAPANDIIGHIASDGPFKVTLQKGQTYSATAFGILGPQHLMGSTVTSDKPIAITIKDDSIGGAGYYDCEDLAGDQIVPLELVGTKYISIPGYLSNGPAPTPPTDHLFILATQNNTKITINGIPENKLLTIGETYWKKSFNEVLYVETNFPVYVLQLSGIGCEVGHVLLPQLECSGSKTVGFMRSNQSIFYMHLLVPAGGETKFIFNGDPSVIRVDSFHDVPHIPLDATQWKYARIPLTTYQLPSNAKAIITNSIDFHLAIIDGDESGVRYGYFSNFNAFTAVPKSIPGTDKPFCENDSIQLFCDIGSSEDISFSWQGPNGFVSTVQNPVIRNLKFADAGTYTCIATKPNCSSVTIRISVNVTPPIQRLLSYKNHLCEKDTLVISVSSSAAGVSFLWSGANGYTSSASNISIPGATTTIAGDYIVTTTDAIGCFVYDTVAVKVNPLPSNTITGINTICENDSLSINVASSITDAVFQWSGPASYTSTTAKVYIPKMSSVNGGAYTLKTTTAAGCSVKDTVNVTVNSLPVTLASGSNTICESDTIYLNGSSSAAGVSFEWRGPAGYSSTIPKTYISSASLANSGAYVLTTSLLTGCFVKDTVNVKVSPLPSAQITGSNAICENDSLSLYGSSSSAGASFQWKGPASYTSTTTKAYIAKMSSVNGGLYVLTTTSPAGCWVKDTINVIVSSIPSALISGNTTLCENDSLSLNGSSSSAGVLFQWNGPANYAGNTFKTYIIHSVIGNSGVYVLTATNIAGCAAKDSVVVSINPLPLATITSNAPPCRLQTLQLTNKNMLAGSTYSWTGNKGLASSLQNISISPFTYTDTGKYYLTVSSNSCIAKDSVTVGLREIPAIKFETINGLCPTTEPIQIVASDTSGIPGSGQFTGAGISAAGIFDPTTVGAGTALIRYTYTADNGCSDYKEQSVILYPAPVVSTILPVTIFAGGSVWLNTTVTGDIKSFNWTPITGLSDPVLESPLATPPFTIDYIVTVTSDKGCLATDTAVIKVLNGIKIPNAFSPNGDAINDKWMIDNLAGFVESKVNIFDRYGKNVFSSKGYNVPWDGNYNGNPLPVATYYYVITISDGHLSQTYNGWVVLLR